MRAIALEACVCILALLFLAMMCAIARHRALRRREGAQRTAALAEYVWAAVPWVFIVGCALPAMRMA